MKKILSILAVTIMIPAVTLAQPARYIKKGHRGHYVYFFVAPIAEYAVNLTHVNNGSTVFLGWMGGITMKPYGQWRGNMTIGWFYENSIYGQPKKKYSGMYLDFNYPLGAFNFGPVFRFGYYKLGNVLWDGHSAGILISYPVLGKKVNWEPTLFLNKLGEHEGAINITVKMIF